MGCEYCGAPTTNRLCKDCDLADRAEERAQARTDGGALTEESAHAIVTADTFETVLDAVGCLVDECKLHLDADGPHIRAVDPANVGMVDVNLGTAAFESYHGTDGTIGVNLERLQDVVGMADSGDLVHLDLNDETRTLDIRIGGLSYTLALIDPDSIRQEPDIPELDLSANVQLEARHLSRGVTAADLCSDHITLGADPEARTVTLSAEGDTDDVEVTVDEDDLLDAEVAEPVSSLFSLDYLDDMTGVIPDSTAVRIELGNEFPVKLHWGIGEGAGEVTFMLAPRIQSD